jgi:hypothetical protein
MSTDRSTPRALGSVHGHENWLEEVARGLDPRVRAALDVSDPEGPEVLAVSDEALTVLTAALQGLMSQPAPRRGGVAPVLGQGVVAEFRKLARAEENGSRSGAEGSHIDERR